MPIVIDLEIGRGFEKTADRVNELSAALKGLREETKSVGQSFSGGGGGKITKATKDLGGIYTKQAEALERYNKALAENDALEQKNSKWALFKANNAVRAAERRMAMEAAGVPDWMATARVAIGPGGKLQMFPLLNRLIADGKFNASDVGGIADLGGAGGPGGAGGGGGDGGAGGSGGGGGAGGFGGIGALGKIPKIPFLGPMIAVGVALEGFRRALESFSGLVRPQGQAGYTSGGTPQEIAQLSGIGRYLGMTPEQAGNRAVALGDALRGGGFGAAYMRSKGIVDMGPYTIDKATNQLRVLDELRQIRSESQAVRVARDLGVSDQLWVRDLSDSDYRRLKDGARASGTPEMRRKAARWEATKAELGNWFDRIKLNFIDNITGGANRDRNEKALEGLRAAMEPKHANKKKSGSGEPGDANTKALEDNTRALRASTEQIGGGKRAAGAIPAGWRYMMMEEALRGQAAQLGAFAI